MFRTFKEAAGFPVRPQPLQSWPVNLIKRFSDSMLLPCWSYSCPNLGMASGHYQSVLMFELPAETYLESFLIMVQPAVVSIAPDLA